MLDDAQKATQNGHHSPDNDWARMGAQWHGARRLAASLPALVAHYLSRLGETVHLVHVGPRSFELAEQMGGHYHWLPSLAPGEFDALLARADLFLSANITGTTVAKAMTLGIPVVVLHNSVSASTAQEAGAQIGKELATQRFAIASTEGMAIIAFLSPILGAVADARPIKKRLLGLFMAVGVAAVAAMYFIRRGDWALASLLFNATARESQLHRQNCYVNQVYALPRGAELVTAGLGA